MHEVLFLLVALTGIGLLGYLVTILTPHVFHNIGLVMLLTGLVEGIPTDFWSQVVDSSDAPSRPAHAGGAPPHPPLVRARRHRIRHRSHRRASSHRRPPHRTPLTFQYSVIMPRHAEA